MKDGVGDQTPVVRKEVFNEYLNYYNEIWCKGNIKLCQENHVIGGAKRFLLLETDPGKRFFTFDFYLTASECVKGFKDCRTFFSTLIKATEMLEIFCVNLFLYPWKKEIKVLKTFTGPFVYCIQPVLSKSATKSILETIGYHLETDTEYRLTNKADPETAKKMGFELFMARIECEYLLELMGQQSPSECLEILQRRATPLPHSHRATEETAAEYLQKQKEEDDEVLPNGCPLVDPGPLEADEVDLTEVKPTNATPSRQQEDGQVLTNLEVQSIDTTHTSGIETSRTFLNEDQSLMEIRQNYPDLAIRQKLIFRKPLQGLGGRRIKENPSEEGSGLTKSASSDTSGPQSISIHTTTVPKTHLTEAVAKPQPLEGKAYKTTVTIHGPTAPQIGVTVEGRTVDDADDTDELNKLAEKMGQQHVQEPGEENLKYPVEETVPPNPSGHVFHHQGSTRCQNQPIMCHPSLLNVCTIAGCGCCDGAGSPHKDSSSGDTIKEPPNSFYVPTSLLEPPVLDPPQKDQEGLSPQPTEEELLKTYVMVDEPLEEVRS
ncbi:uncharacterized protein LOC105028771 [Esox lucius]|uniref:Spermatogenesis-associated protein 2 PUB-like domain-containing protein n=1 Tax=Esox lucius TaxID=8010 RepID=A0A3P8YSB7_ESOLU|nr:uncharacterized protein LOC105028771 [Esox lucius]